MWLLAVAAFAQRFKVYQQILAAHVKRDDMVRLQSVARRGCTSTLTTPPAITGEACFAQCTPVLGLAVGLDLGASDLTCYSDLRWPASYKSHCALS